MTREQTYTSQLKALGIYNPAFDPEIKTLADLERDLQRLTKRWKEAGRPTVSYDAKGTATSDKTFDAITGLRKEILAHRDALGLTPRSLRRIRGSLEDPSAEPEEDNDSSRLTVLEAVRQKYAL